MSKMYNKKIVISIFFIIAIMVSKVEATPSGGSIPPNFTYKSGEWYDTWGITRTNADGRYGFLPLLLSETIGENSELAIQIGERFRSTYFDNNAMASMILKYVQTWVEYGYDIDNVFMNRVGQEEWAWNADELANSFDEISGIVAVGDCEDMAFLCATLYIGADIDIALVDAPGHVALLIWLPDYPNANKYWDLSDDDHDAGWIWVEATGPTNPLGWTPSEFTDGEWTAWILDGDTYYQQKPVQNWADDSDTDEINIWDIIIIIIILLILRRK